MYNEKKRWFSCPHLGSIVCDSFFFAISIFPRIYQSFGYRPLELS
jgi:hypothetical protein